MGHMGLARRAFARASVVAATQCAFWATIFLLSGCSSEELGDFPSETCDFSEVAPSSQKTPLTITSFWSSDDEEKKALDVLRTALSAEQFDVDIDMEGRNNRIDAQRSLVEAFKAGRLPDVFQVNGGSDLLRWVTKRGPNDAAVCSLDPLATKYDWRGAYFPEALAPVTCHEQLYALPIGVHRINNLFYNQEVFDQLQALATAQDKILTVPSELSSLEELLEELRVIASLGYATRSGAPFVPLEISSLNEGPLTILAFENVLLSLGQRAYETLWQGQLDKPGFADEAQLRAALTKMLGHLHELASFAGGTTRISWQEALRAVGKGDALFTVNGDWGWAQLIDGSADAVRTTTFPGTDDAFVYTPDSFAVPREQDKNGFAARAFLYDVLANEQVLREFSNRKHSLPPRSDLPDDWLEELATDDQRQTYARFKYCSRGGEGCRLLLAVSGLAPAPGDNDNDGDNDGDDDCYDDIEPLLRLVVTGEPLSDTETNQLCTRNRTASVGQAEQKLIALLLATGKQPFAADCR